MNRILDSVLFWLVMPVLVLLVLLLGSVMALQCWLEYKLHDVDYDACMCEKDPLACDDFPYGD